MHVLLIDDDVGLTTMLSEYLEAEGCTSTAVHSGEQGLDVIRSAQFDVVLLDIMLPGIGGLEVLRQIRTISRVPVIMLTARGDDIDRVVGLEAGADDYVPKPYFPRELVARINAVCRRATMGERPERVEQLLRCGPLSIDLRRYEVDLAGDAIALTASEMSVLELLVRSQGEVVRKDTISREVLGRPHHPHDRGVDVHISNIRQKIASVKPGMELIETVRGVGYRLRDDR